MSISIKDFRKGKFKENYNKRNEHPVLIFLKKKSRAYKVREIVKAVGMKEDTIRSMLKVLEKEKIIEHKTPYYAVKKNDNRNNKKH